MRRVTIKNAFSEGNNGRSPVVREFKTSIEEVLGKSGAKLDKFSVEKGTVSLQIENDEAADAVIALVKRMSGVEVTVVESSFEAFLNSYNTKKGASKK